MNDAPARGTSVAPARTQGTVRVVGTGLLGTSIGLALRELGIDVVLANHSPTSLALAVEYGAGRAATEGDTPAVIVVAVPPDVTAKTVAAELAVFPNAIVTDVASVKHDILHELRESGVDLSRYVGSHPMAGRERGGAIMARADLFTGRPWVVCTDALAQGSTLDQHQHGIHIIEALAHDLGATVIQMTSTEHDQAVAVVSHLPQVAASLTAARLQGVEAHTLQIAGQGLRDTTRVASSDPSLWTQSLLANHEPVAQLLMALRDDLDGVIAALQAPEETGAIRTIAAALTAGNIGVAGIPGKHGSSERFTVITVAIDDKPGELARLLTEIGELDINLEDMRLEHSPGAQVGFVELAVLPDVADRAVTDLTERGWRLA